MSLLRVPFVEETTITEGTGTLSLNGSTNGHIGFVSAFGTGGLCLYAILWGQHWEYGLGTVTDGSPDTLSRDLCIASSVGGQKLSLGAGTKRVYVEHIPEAFNANGVEVFADGDSSPSVKNGNVFVCDNSAATVITSFDDGLPGQKIHILFTNGNTTMQQGSILKQPAGLDITPTANDVLTYARIAFTGSWNLIANSVNG